jgi:hypothetical protein
VRRGRGRLGWPGGGNGLHHTRHAGSLGPGRGTPPYSADRFGLRFRSLAVRGGLPLAGWARL